MGASLQFGIIGLGCIGGGLALQAAGQGMHVVGYDPRGSNKELLSAGIDLIDKHSLFHQHLQTPRKIFLSMPAGKAVDQVMAQLTPVLEPGDVIIDGGNSYWGDTVLRHRKCRDEHGIRFVDCGTSGGARGARNGACFMMGGAAEDFQVAEPILARLAVQGGLVHCGAPGSGHYANQVHNGIEFSMLQAINEGVHMLQEFPQELPVPDILRAWNRGSAIRSWLIERLEEEYSRSAEPKAGSDYIDPAEINRLVEDAMHMEVPIPVIAQALMQRFKSHDKPPT